MYRQHLFRLYNSPTIDDKYEYIKPSHFVIIKAIIPMKIIPKNQKDRLKIPHVSVSYNHIYYNHHHNFC